MGWETISCVLLCLVSITGGDDANYVKKAHERFVTEPEINLETEIIKLKAEVAELKTKTQGSTFTRWGKNDCPSIVDFIYRGYLAGTKYNDAGSTSDTLCLPTDPTWDRYNDTHTVWSASVYGTELDVGNIFDKDVNNEDMPCVVCRSPLPTTIMIPARTNCYQGWTLQYRGYLMSNTVLPGRASYDTFYNLKAFATITNHSFRESYVTPVCETLKHIHIVN